MVYKGYSRLFFRDLLVSARPDLFTYLGFLSRTFTIYRTAGKGEDYLFNSSLPLPPVSQAIRH